MSIRSRSLPSILFLTFVAILAVGSETSGSGSRKLDETDQSKCGGCPCGNPCATKYPPLPPPPPPPPPAHKKPKPATRYCPPPPPSGFIYITGPPGELYPVDQSYNAGRRGSAAALPAAIGAGLVALLMTW